jgi:hypothetical protein
MRIDNEYANQLLLSVRKGICIQDFMNAVSGVEGYRVDDLSRQGAIRGAFAKELIAEQFILDIEDIIAVFWHGVFEKLGKAKLFNENVEIKHPNGHVDIRPTKNNPIHYLRNHGKMAVRNHITALYKKNLQQHCSICGFKTTIKNEKKCPKCSNLMATIYKFSDFESQEIGVEQKIRDADMGLAIGTLLGEFAEDILKPGTRAYQVLKILTEPGASKEMCAACNLCPNAIFDIDSCTNYNANIGRWLGINKAMVATKVNRIRKALPKFLENKGTAESLYLLDIMPKRFKLNS